MARPPRRLAVGSRAHPRPSRATTGGDDRPDSGHEPARSCDHQSDGPDHASAPADHAGRRRPAAAADNTALAWFARRTGPRPHQRWQPRPRTQARHGRSSRHRSRNVLALRRGLLGIVVGAEQGGVRRPQAAGSSRVSQRFVYGCGFIEPRCPEQGVARQATQRVEVAADQASDARRS